MTRFRIIDNDHAKRGGDPEDFCLFEGTIQDWEDAYGGLDLVCPDEDSKLAYINDWAFDRLDAYVEIITNP